MRSSSSQDSGFLFLKNSTVALAGAVPMPLIATTGFPAILTSSGISPPRPKRACSVTAAASTVATPESMAFPSCVRIRKPASTSKLFAAPTISRVPRTGGNMVWRTCAPSGSAAAMRASTAIDPGACRLRAETVREHRSLTVAAR